jgi:hypothetical protein
VGCLFALFGGLFPRLALLVLWIARPVLVDAAFNTFILPLLGILVARYRPLGGQLHPARPDTRAELMRSRQTKQPATKREGGDVWLRR